MSGVGGAMTRLELPVGCWFLEGERREGGKEGRRQDLVKTVQCCWRKEVRERNLAWREEVRVW